MYELNKDKISSLLQTKLNIFVYNEVDSTNSQLRCLYNGEPLLVVADKQSQGRGRKGHSFFSPEKGLYFSYGFKYPFNEKLTLIAALSMLEAIEKLYQLKLSIKWVNDLFYQNRKVGGILCELHNDLFIMGLGLNILENNFPDDLKDKAISLNIEIDRNLLLATFINIFNDYLLDDSEVISKYTNHCFVINKEVSFNIDNVTYQGIATSIDERGCLIVKNDQRTFVLDSGEISLIKY